MYVLIQIYIKCYYLYATILHINVYMHTVHIDVYIHSYISFKTVTEKDPGLHKCKTVNN